MKARPRTTHGRSKARARLSEKTAKRTTSRVKKKYSQGEAKSGGKKFAQRAIAMVKLAGITLRRQEQNNHLQGLYAELGKIAYEQRVLRSARAGHRGSGIDGLADKIMEMRKKMDRMEREAGVLRAMV